MYFFFFNTDKFNVYPCLSGCISFRIICGESGSAPSPEKIEEDRQLIRKVLSKYQLSDIFNLDETALFYRLPPNKTLANIA